MPLNLPSTPRILIVRFSSLGDVTLSTGILPGLRSTYPGSILTFLTKKPYDELLAFAPELDEIMTLEPEESLLSLAGRLRSRHPDLLIDLHGNLRSRVLCALLPGIPCVRASSERWRRMSLVWLKHKTRHGIQPATERYADALRSLNSEFQLKTPKLTLNGNVTSIQERLDLRRRPRPLIGFCINSQHATKRWGAAAAKRCLMSLLESTRGSAVLVGGHGNDKEKIVFPSGAPILNLMGKTSLTELAAVLACCAVLVTVDSGPLHVAEALGVPVVALFGPTVSDFGFAPLDPKSRLIEVPLDCRPCSLHGGKTCPLGHHRCMEDISAERVIQETLSVMARRI